MTSFISVHITASSIQEAEAIARALVEAQLAACANIISGVASIYRWEGKIEQSDEVLLILKTRASLFDKITHKVKDLHSYSCPCIVAMPIEQGYAPYLDWLNDSVPDKS